MEFSQRLRELMDENGTTNYQLAKRLDIHPTTVANWLDGKTPRKAAQPRPADYFHVSVDYLLGNVNDPSFHLDNERIKKEISSYGDESETDEKERPAVSDKTLPKNCFPYNPTAVRPILGSIPAGYPALAVQEIIGYAPVDVPDSENCFWLLVKGDSMINAGIQPGDLVLIRTQPTADDGQIVACRVNGDEATLKRFHRQGDNVVLAPENPAYPLRIVPQSDFDSGYAAVIGVVIRMQRIFA